MPKKKQMFITCVRRHYTQQARIQCGTGRARRKIWFRDRTSLPKETTAAAIIDSLLIRIPRKHYVIGHPVVALSVNALFGLPKHDGRTHFAMAFIMLLNITHSQNKIISTPGTSEATAGNNPSRMRIGIEAGRKRCNRSSPSISRLHLRNTRHATPLNGISGHSFLEPRPFIVKDYMFNRLAATIGIDHMKETVPVLDNCRVGTISRVRIVFQVL